MLLPTMDISSRNTSLIPPSLHLREFGPLFRDEKQRFLEGRPSPSFVVRDHGSSWCSYFKVGFGSRPSHFKQDNARIKCSDSVFIRLGHYVHDWFSIVAR